MRNVPESIPGFHRNATVRWVATGIAAASLLAAVWAGAYRLRFVGASGGILLASLALIVLWKDKLPRSYVVAWTTLALVGAVGMLTIHSVGFYLFPLAVVAALVLVPVTVHRVAPANPRPS